MRSNFLHNRNVVFIAALVLLYVLSVAVNFGVLELAGEEPRRAIVSIEMLHSGNFFKPTVFGWDYYNKPPLFNWVQAGLIWLTGSASEFVLRLPSLLFYLLGGYVLFRFNRQFFPKQIALLSAFFLLTCGDIYFYGLANGAEIDVFYSFLVYLQVIFIFWFYTKGNYLNLYLASYFFCALGFLTKGFPSLVFQGLTLAALCVLARSLRPFFRWQHLAGVFLFVLLAGGYFLLYSRYNPPQRLFVNLLNESLIKSAIGERSGQLFNKTIVYPFLFLKLLVPWSFLLLLLFFKKVKHGFWQNPMVRFSALFILFNLWIYWFTGQPKIRYVYMFLPFACTILAHIYHRFSEAFPGLVEHKLKHVWVFFFLVLLALFASPFLANVSLFWVTGLAAALVFFLISYLRSPANRIWKLLAGIMLLRLLYAALIIPVQYKAIPNYQRQLADAAKATNQSFVQYLSPSVPFPVVINNHLFSYQFETIAIPPIISFQIPYYYYLQTGKMIVYDTVPQPATLFFSLASQLGKQPIDSLYSFFDTNMNERVVFYRLKGQKKEVASRAKISQ